MMGIEPGKYFGLIADMGCVAERGLARLRVLSEPPTASGWFDTLGQWISGLLTLDGDTFQATINHENGLLWALALLLTAGVSVAIGQSIVLFSNRVPGNRFLISLLGSGAVGLLAVLFWSASIWATSRLLFGVTEPWRSFLIVTALGFAPALFGFALFMPYLGVIFGWMLRVWVALTIVVGVGIVANLPLWPALLCCVPGWLFLEVLTRLPLLDLRGFPAWIWSVITGRPRRYQGEEVAMWLAEQSRSTTAAGVEKNGGA